MAIITVAEYKAFAGITASTWDAQLAVIIPALQDVIERWCNRTFDTATFTEKHDGAGTDELNLRNPPIASVTSVTITTGSDSVALAATDYAFSTTGTGRLWMLPVAVWVMAWEAASAWSNAHGGLTGRPCFPIGRENITVVYAGGYSTMPAGLKLAMYRLTAITLAQAGIDTTMKSETLGQYAYTRLTPAELVAAAMSAQIGVNTQQMLAAYRRVPEL